MKRRHSRGDREKKSLQKDPTVRAARALLVPTALLLTLGIVVSCCSFLEEFGEGTLFYESSNRVIFQGVGISVICLGALGGLTIHVLHKSLRTRISGEKWKKSHICQCGRHEITRKYFSPRQEKQNEACSISTDNNLSKIAELDLGEPTYYFPPVEIHAYDIKLWELKCSGETDVDDDNDTDYKDYRRNNNIDLNIGTITEKISENKVSRKKADNTVSIKDLTKNEESKEE